MSSVSVERYLDDNVVEVQIDTSSTVNLVNLNVVEQEGDEFKSSYRYTLSHAIIYDPSRYTALVGLRGWDVPCGYYWVNRTNNSFVCTIDSVSETISIRFGSYLARQLGELIAANLKIKFPAYTFTLKYQPEYNTYLIKVTTPDIVSFDFDTPNSMHIAMGFKKREYTFTDIAGIKTIESPYSINVVEIKTLKVYLTNYNFTDSIENGKFSALLYKHRVDVTRNQYDRVFPPLEYKRVSGSNGIIKDIEIDIKDEAGNFIDFRNNDWSMTLHFKFVKRHDVSGLTAEETIRLPRIAIPRNDVPSSDF